MVVVDSLTSMSRGIPSLGPTRLIAATATFGEGRAPLRLDSLQLEAGSDLRHGAWKNVDTLAAPSYTRAGFSPVAVPVAHAYYGRSPRCRPSVHPCMSPCQQPITSLYNLAFSSGHSSPSASDPSSWGGTSLGPQQSQIACQHNEPILEPNTQAFIDTLAAQGRKPLYTLSYADARRVLEDVLCSRP
jgi:hypothetical protein